MSELRPYAAVRPGISEMLARDVSGWAQGAFICGLDLARYRARRVEALLLDERGALHDLDRQVIDSFVSGGLVVRLPDIAEEQAARRGDRIADAVARIGGSWGFIVGFAIVLVAWVTLNLSSWLAKPFDPYPFILLNLVLSTVAALQAPVIMMSQRRQEAKDRARAENDYRINLKAELEVRQLHEKIDHQITAQWHRLAELQQIQIELLEERLGERK
ncbi:DUF1003 domain-containing protein [Limimaricola sp. G21655-S1]|uniref:DUF1003 domain-containing protein n=1 Tax=Limimaricola sp. G21655-S1 TaxID=3014768 RepID=UPI0022AEA97D|nr:DUF1003 domain-containing protein [Limimaricola sp. G21655-S1]MCZ4262235.1 DUF1003 domain-containing protein [Limimaricola sp. G21655-S1]